MSYDFVITDAVQVIRDRFGVQGLRDLIEVAQSELAQAEAALASMLAGDSDEMGDETKQFFVFFDDENPSSKR